MLCNIYVAFCGTLKGDSMKFKPYSPSEMAAWKRGKIAAYYANKSRCSGNSKPYPQKVKFSDFSADAAMKKALERTYGSTK